VQPGIIVQYMHFDVCLFKDFPLGPRGKNINQT
jgi:hypothetical protein